MNMSMVGIWCDIGCKKQHNTLLLVMYPIITVLFEGKCTGNHRSCHQFKITYCTSPIDIKSIIFAVWPRSFKIKPLHVWRWPRPRDAFAIFEISFSDFQQSFRSKHVTQVDGGILVGGPSVNLVLQFVEVAQSQDMKTNYPSNTTWILLCFAVAFWFETILRCGRFGIEKHWIKSEQIWTHRGCLQTYCPRHVHFEIHVLFYTGFVCGRKTGWWLRAWISQHTSSTAQGGGGSFRIGKL